MSNLVGMALGATVDYWWDRLAGHPDRWKFVLTKYVEEWVYKKTVGSPHAMSTGVAGAKARAKIVRQELPQAPHVVVIVPARNTSARHTAMLDRLLGLLASQTYPADTVVIDDASPFDIQDERCHVLRNQQRRGPAASRNLGIAWALGRGADVVFMTDADCMPDRTWIEAGLDHFRANPYAHILSGNTVAAGETWFDRYHEINGTLNGRRLRGTDQLLYGPTCNLAMRRVVLESLKFDEAFPYAACEDIEFCCRCGDAGFLILLNRQMQVRHDFGYRRWRPLHNVRAFLRLFRKYAGSETILLDRVPDYFERLAPTESVAAGNGRDGPSLVADNAVR